MTKKKEKELLKYLLSSPPMDVYNEDNMDTQESNLELVEPRPIKANEEELESREIGSANLFLASAFLSTINDIDLPAKSDEDVIKAQKLWQQWMTELKEDNFLREKPNTLRESFKIV